LDAAETIPQDKIFFNKAYQLAQLTKNLYFSRDLKKALVKKSIEDPNNLISRYENLNRSLSVNLRDKNFELKEGRLGSNDLSEQNREIQKEILYLEKEIKKQIPAYFKMSDIDLAEVEVLQKNLKSNEVLIDYFYFYDKVKVVKISDKSYEIFSNNIKLNEINNLYDQIRNSLIPINGVIQPFEAKKAYLFNKQNFLFLSQNIDQYDDIIVVPDGPLNSLPLHILPLADYENCLDCSNISFNLEKFNFRYLPTIQLINNDELINNEFKQSKKYINEVSIKDFKNNIKKVSKTVVSKINIDSKLTDIVKSKLPIKSKKPLIVESQNNYEGLYYLGLGDPDLYINSNNNYALNEKKKITMLRSLFDTKNITSSKIREIYGPVKGSAEEIQKVSETLLPLNSKILLREEVQEKVFKDMDLTNFKVIHIATHGEVSGAISKLEQYTDPKRSGNSYQLFTNKMSLLRSLALTLQTVARIPWLKSN
jgi:CHAT domain-containing protein